MIDMKNNRVQWCLLNDEEKEHISNWMGYGGVILLFIGGTNWEKKTSDRFADNCVYRTFGDAPKIPMTVAWEHIPVGYDWVAAGYNGEVYCFNSEPKNVGSFLEYDDHAIRIDNFPGLVNRGNVDWKDTLVRRPK